MHCSRRSRIYRGHPCILGRVKRSPGSFSDPPHLQRHGISRLPEVDGDLPAKKFKASPIGFFHIHIAEVQTAEGRLYLFVAIDRTSKFAFVALHRKALRKTTADFPRHLVEAVPYRINIVLTDNGAHFISPR
jgi:transposase InsO family protein